MKNYTIKIKHFNTIVAEIKVRAISEYVAQQIGRSLIGNFVPPGKTEIIII
jgi:hypothetical protein